jgi:hypothetical protein
MGQLDSGGTVAAERGPQSEDHAAGLVERHLIVGLLSAGPAECLVEGSRSAKVPNPKRDHRDPLFHLPSMA